MENPIYDVAIVGLGPVGSTAAILMAHAGLKVVAFERDDSVYELPRAVNLDGEIVRGFQAIGLADQVVALLQPVREGDRAGFANSRREWMFGQSMRSFGANGWQPGSMFDQPEFEGYLRRTATDHENVTAHVGCEVVGIQDTDRAVSVAARRVGSGDAENASARFLIGCDGASSFVRKRMDVGWHDLGYDHDWLVVDVIAKPGHTLTNDTIQVCDPDRLATYICTKDPFRRWEFKLNPGETRDEMLDDQRIRSLIDPWTPPDTYEIRRAAVYRFHTTTADTWRLGHIFLAGDAAHQTPPFLGQGMNAGMRDVVNLAWKLSMVINGTAGEELLDTYQRERDAHAHDLVEWAVAIGQLMEHLAAVEAAERAGEASPEIPARLHSSGYGQGRANPPLRDGLIRLDQVSDTGSTGYLFSQPIVRDTNGVESRLDELLGNGFAIVAKTNADVLLSEAGQSIVDRLGLRCTLLAGLTEVKGHFDRLFGTSSAAIVRPDRYVFGHTSDTVTLDDLLGELAEGLALGR